ncbi:hypothetical protein B0H16DRAFT_1454634 [Mycena metata]|uniref:Uncharacterized protein n=1 Tax=Mycena metata TaxID=1033252 RepID=A0AAD7JHZ5_9AGAR|nr:hypothetical protein B0H16DRAFT_1454634 [Mycena metata]
MTPPNKHCHDIAARSLSLGLLVSTLSVSTNSILALGTPTRTVSASTSARPLVFKVLPVSTTTAADFHSTLPGTPSWWQRRLCAQGTHFSLPSAADFHSTLPGTPSWWQRRLCAQGTHFSLPSAKTFKPGFPQLPLGPKTFASRNPARGSSTRAIQISETTPRQYDTTLALVQAPGFESDRYDELGSGMANLPWIFQPTEDVLVKTCIKSLQLTVFGYDNLLALREKARARVARRREQAKGTELEVGLKASERLNHARFRERNKAELAHRQRTRRAQAYVAKHGWDAWVDHSDRLNLHAQKRTATAQRQLDEDLAEAEEEAEWAARRLKQAQGVSGLSCSAIDASAGDDDD